ncbi:PREDICTED: olfactory receptor 2T29-like [Dipodomys ordii]|uniref:Olfactory receptor n=1 Tax=Dipodomys ordii TaxID=10020 RepID=A0A1S3F314_DIPOR|nr:PREDICTED: olfactory receptor 2T29-like [Dipodomys ordii]
MRRDAGAGTPAWHSTCVRRTLVPTIVYTVVQVLQGTEHPGLKAARSRQGHASVPSLSPSPGPGSLPFHPTLRSTRERRRAVGKRSRGFRGPSLKRHLSVFNTISVSGCGVQMFLYLTLGGAEFFLLATMSYDRYAAICHPLRYPVLLSCKACLVLALGCWVLGSVDGFMLTPVTMTFPFCKSREIHHFFCEVPAVLKLSCSDTSLYKTLMYLCCVLMLLIPVTVISTSYALVLLTVHRMKSAEGRKKALATCSSHMTVVLLFYGAAIYTYMLPSSYHTPEKDMVVSVFYTILTPVLNPLIYSLRNSSVTRALKKTFTVRPSFQETMK